MKLSGGSKIEFLADTELCDIILKSYINNKVRNAIGHNTYEVESNTQLIELYPGSGSASTIFLYITEYGVKCWDMFTSLLEL
jgi:hypothetical protein